jgi:hypothetical protein
MPVGSVDDFHIESLLPDVIGVFRSKMIV